MKRALLTVAAALATACDTRDAAPPAAAPRVEVGQPAPAYVALSMAGDTVSLAGLRGKVVLMNVWATWCGPCRQEIPDLRAIHETYKRQGLEVIGISVDADGSDDAIRDFAREFRMDYPIWRDPDESVSATFRMAGVPATFLVDRQGVLRWKTTGVLVPGDTTLTAAIAQALRN